MILVIFAVALSVALGLAAIWHMRRRARTPVELRGDWWPRFERQFRAYAARQDQARSRRVRHKPR